MCEFQFPGLDHLGSEIMLLPLAGLLALPLLLAGRARSEGYASLPLFFLFSSILIFTQAVLTPQAGGAHHLLLLWPFPQLFAISVFARLHRGLRRPMQLIVSITFASLLVFVVVTQVEVELHYQKLLSRPELVSPKWSPRIYDLSREIESKDVDLIVSTDWGLHPQLSALASPENRTKYRDLWITMKSLDENPPLAKQVLEILAEKRFLFLLHAERTEEQAPSRQNSLHFLEDNFPEREILRMEDDAGRPLYEIHIVNGS